MKEALLREELLAIPEVVELRPAGRSSLEVFRSLGRILEKQFKSRYENHLTDCTSVPPVMIWRRLRVSMASCAEVSPSGVLA